MSFYKQYSRIAFNWWKIANGFLFYHRLAALQLLLFEVNLKAIDDILW